MNPTTATAAPPVPGRDIDPGFVAAYRRDGFVHVPGVVSPERAARYAEGALRVAHDHTPFQDGAVFTQLVNAYRVSPVLAELTRDPWLGQVAEALAGVPLRIWHDQVLIKQPHNGAATEFHQDAPYWPHRGSRHALSAWVALVDVPVERGCMTFLPGSQNRTDLRAQDLTDAEDLFRVAPDLVWSRRVTIPLRAGDCTFHNAYTGHGATPNLTDDPRIAHVVIYVDAEATYSGAPHVVTDPLGLEVGAVLPDEHFPPVAAF
jgi:hypothetical protein